jgi:hypothetical protein
VSASAGRSPPKRIAKPSPPPPSYNRAALKPDKLGLGTLTSPSRPSSWDFPGIDASSTQDRFPEQFAASAGTVVVVMTMHFRT